MLQEKHLESQAQLPALKSDETITLGPIALTVTPSHSRVSGRSGLHA